jgi:hypothetical protein
LAITAIPQVGTVALPVSTMALRMTTPMPHGTRSGARFAAALEKDNSQRMASLPAPAKKGAGALLTVS